MGLESNTGLGVSSRYGQFAVGGVLGEYPSTGVRRQFVLNLDSAAIASFEVFQENTSIKVTGVDTTFVTGTVTAVSIGGIAVIAATDAAPVSITAATTGIVTQTGGTAGQLIIHYKQVAGPVLT